MVAIKRSMFRHSVLWILLIVLTAGCGAGGPDADRSQGSGEPSISVDIPAGVMSAPANPSADAAAEDWRVNLGYGKPTGRWFLLDGSGHLGYGLTGGTKRPGDEFSVSLFAHEADFRLDRDIRIRLTELTDEWEPAGVVVDETVRVGPVGSHEIVYAGKLPDRENVQYALGAEIIGPDGAVEDVLAELIRVPAAVINASAALDRTVYGESDESAVLTVANNGPTVLVFGVDYRIERKADGEWRDVPLDLAFIDIALMLWPGESHDLQVDLRGLAPGAYRVVKPVWAEGLDLTAELTAEFAVE